MIRELLYAACHGFRGAAEHFDKFMDGVGTINFPKDGGRLEPLSDADLSLTVGKGNCSTKCKVSLTMPCHLRIACQAHLLLVFTLPTEYISR